MKRFTIAGIGELLWDVFPEKEVLGGAPVNFAYHVTALGATGVPVSTIGDDYRGSKALEELGKKGLMTSAISMRTDYPTGYVDILVNDDGSASYRFPDEVAWDYLEINSDAEKLRKELDAVCFGTLAQRSDQSRRAIQDYLRGLDKKTLKIFDVNLRLHFYSVPIIEASLMQADIVKLNDEESAVLATLFNISPEQRAFLETLVHHFSLSMVILTRGNAGSLIATSDEISEHQGSAVKVVDTVGAGDSFTAAVTIGYLQGLPLKEIHTRASERAAYVCTKRGAMVAVPDHLKMIPDL